MRSGGFRGVVDRDGVFCLRDLTVREQLHEADVLEPSERSEDLRLGQARGLVQRVRVERAAGVVDRLGDRERFVDCELAGAGEEAMQPDVLGPVEQDGTRRVAVTTRAPDLLVVRVDGVADLGVDDRAHVRLVDAHAERNRRDHDLDLVLHEGRLRRLALVPTEAGVICERRDAGLAQLAGELVAATACRRVDDRRPLLTRHVVDERAQLLRLVVVRLHREVDVRAIETAHHLDRILQSETLGDLGAHGRRRRRRQRQRRRIPERLGHRSESQVLRPEVMAPLADAVRLVDDQELRLRLAELLERLLGRELLRREEQVLELVVVELVEQLLALRLAQRRVQRGCRPDLLLFDLLDLVALQREQRRDDDRRLAALISVASS